MDQARYIGWLSLPRVERFPKSEVALSRELGVDRSTLYRWRRLPGLMPTVRKQIRDGLGDRYADVLKKLEDLAAKGSIQHQRLYLELLGEAVQGAPEGGYMPNVKVLVGVDLALVGNTSLVVSLGELQGDGEGTDG